MRSDRQWIGVCIGWGLGAAGIAALNFSRTFLLRYMTDYLELAAIVAGTLFVISKLFDAVTDPIMGILSDRTQSTLGRRRPYMLAGSIMCFAAYVLLFSVPAFDSKAWLAFYVMAVLMFYAVAYTTFNVPYLALSVDITRNYHARSTLASYRSIGIALGYLLGGLGGPLMIAYGGGGLTGHYAMAWFLGGTSFLLLIFSFALTSKIPKSPRSTYVVPIRLQLTSLVKNRPFASLLAAKGTLFIAFAVLTTSSAYFTKYVLQADDRILALFFGLFFLGTSLSQPVWLAIARCLDKARTYVIASIMVAVINLSWLLVDAAEPQVYFVVRALAVGFMMGGVMAMGNSMLPDTMEFDNRRYQSGREGLLAGIYTTLEKGGTAIGIAIVALVLGFSGYIESGADIDPVQVATVVQAIKLLFAVVPSVALLLSALSILFYTLKEESFNGAAHGDDF